MTKYRYTATQDIDAPSPLEDYPDVALGVFRAGYRTVSALTGEESDALYAFQRVYEVHGDAELALKVARRYTRATGENHHVAVFEYRGYSQSDWADVVISGPLKIDLDALVWTWTHWARGDVYTVTKMAGQECSLGETHWETIDSASGIYADNEDAAINVYKRNY